MVSRCVGRDGCGCGFTGGESGGVCPECGGMVLSPGAIAAATELEATWKQEAADLERTKGLSEATTAQVDRFVEVATEESKLRDDEPTVRLIHPDDEIKLRLGDMDSGGMVITSLEEMTEGLRTHPMMEIPVISTPSATYVAKGHQIIKAEATITRTSEEDLSAWMESVISGVERPDWTWPEGATGLRIRLAQDPVVSDGRLNTPDGGIRGDFLDPTGTKPGTIELVGPTRTVTLTGVYPTGHSWADDLADGAIGVHPLRWDIDPQGEARLSTDRPDLQESDLPHAERIDLTHPLVGHLCKLCLRWGDVANYYMSENGTPEVTVYCSSCASEEDGVPWPPEGGES